MSDSDDEYCHESPAHVAESWKDRLQVPCLLAQREIPCLVFGEDALSLVFRVPTVLFSLHILVADKHVGQAVEAITRSSFPYKINTDHLIPNYNDPIIVDPDQTKAYPNSIHLRNTNEPADKHQSSQIIIHPETHFNFIIDDYKLSTSVFMFPEALFPESVRLPQRAAMVDSIIDSLLDPNSGVVTIVGSRELRRWLAYIIVYGIRRDGKIVVAEQLHPDTQELINAVKVENRPFLEAWVRNDDGKADTKAHRDRRRNILRENGDVIIVSKPLPKYPPGNPAYSHLFKATELSTSTARE